MKLRHILIIALALVALLPCPSAIAATQQEPSAKQQEKSKRRQRLADRLIRKAKSDTNEDVMDAVIRLMDEASRRIGVDFDASERTVTIQDEIAEKLDEAIERAAKQRRPRRRPTPKSNADKRRMPTASNDKNAKPGEEKAASKGSEPAESAGEKAAPDGAGPVTGELAELRRGWGHLPARDRDELIQGIEEDYLDRYRQWIEQYYRALQELNE